MAKQRSERALAAAERLYKRKPDATTEEFRKVCERADKATIGKLSNREFNASYVLPFRRSAALKGRRKRTKTKKTTRRPRKTTRRAKRVTKRAKKTRRARRRASPEKRVVRMIRERDAALLAASGDSMKVYEIAARVEDFAAELLKAAGR